MKILMLMLALTMAFTSPFLAYADDEGSTHSSGDDESGGEGSGDTEGSEEPEA